MRRPFSVHLTSHHLPTTLGPDKEREIQALWLHLAVHMVGRGKISCRLVLRVLFTLGKKIRNSLKKWCQLRDQTQLIQKPPSARIKIFSARIVGLFLQLYITFPWVWNAKKEEWPLWNSLCIEKHCGGGKKHLSTQTFMLKSYFDCFIHYVLYSFKVARQKQTTGGFQYILNIPRAISHGIIHIFLADGIYCCGVFNNSLRWNWMTESSIQTVRRRKFNTFMISGWELSCLFCCWHLVYLITSTIQPSVGSAHDIICTVLLCLKLCPIKEFWFTELFPELVILVSQSSC